MREFHDIHRPQHYLEGRGVEPIEVIENFCFCHHLGSVVKYIARAGRKRDAVQDIEKARWYLDREIAQRLSSIGFCINNPPQHSYFTPHEICEDWELNPFLRRALEAIIDSQMRGKSLEFLYEAESALSAFISVEQENPKGESQT